MKKINVTSIAGEDVITTRLGISPVIIYGDASWSIAQTIAPQITFFIAQLESSNTDEKN
jgi:hypothetical protein